MKNSFSEQANQFIANPTYALPFPLPLSKNKSLSKLGKYVSAAHFDSNEPNRVERNEIFILTPPKVREESAREEVTRKKEEKRHFKMEI